MKDTRVHMLLKRQTFIENCANCNKWYLSSYKISEQLKLSSTQDSFSQLKTFNNKIANRRHFFFSF